MHIAFVSGGKDSYYAIYRCGQKIDLGIMLVYEFPRPSPHLINIGKSIETMLLANIPVIIVRLDKGNEFIETVHILRKLSVDVIVAGDVYIDEHLKYMEKLAKEVGATLVEPLWGLDPVELLYKEFESGIISAIIGCVNSLGKWLGIELSLRNIDGFTKYVVNLGLDPLGERGEYHTIVVDGPLHKSSLSYKVIDHLVIDKYFILRLI